ncbi:MAG: glycosyltransferase family 4 protein [Bacteroidota bacterium]
MNIGFIGDYSEDAVNGVSTSAYSIACNLLKLGHQVYFYGLGDTTETYVDKNGIIVKKFTNKFFFSLPHELKTILYNNLDQISIYHLHSVFIPFNYLASKQIKSSGKPYMVTPNGGYNVNILKRNKWLKKFYILSFEDKVIRNADGFSATTDLEVDEITNMRYSGEIRVIPNPVSEVKRSTEPMPTNKCKILYLGRYDIEHKGLDYLLHLFKIVEDTVADTELHLYGAGKDKSKLIKLKEKLALKKLYIYDPVYGTEKGRVIDSATIYIQPSRWEAFGVSIVEAMQRGVPCALTESCHLSQFLKKNSYGIILCGEPEHDAKVIINALKDKDLLSKYSEIGLQIAKRYFTPAKVTGQFEDFYKSIVKENNIYEKV